MNFNVGDRIRITGPERSKQKGKTGKVMSHQDNLVVVVLDQEDNPNSQGRPRGFPVEVVEIV